jgi:hypothetical protein
MEYTSKGLETIYRGRDWSFQKQVAGWLAPGVLFNSGTFTTNPYSNQVIGDASVTAQLAAYNSFPPLTQLQYRNPGYSVYNIVGYDTTSNPPFATLTLDRPWMEPTSGPGQPYIIYQVYFVAPVKDFSKFVEFRDPTNDQPMDFDSMTQAMLAVEDPQRTDFANPRFVVPAGVDQRPGTSTPGWQMFELWPHQGNYVPYTFTYRRRGTLPQTQADWFSMDIPYPINEEMIEWRAKDLLYEFKEAQKDREAPRGSGANWMLLSQMAQKQYKFVLDQAIDIDLNLDGESVTVVHRNRRRYPDGSAYATMNGGLNLGGYPES